MTIMVVILVGFMYGQLHGSADKIVGVYYLNGIPQANMEVRIIFSGPSGEFMHHNSGFTNSRGEYTFTYAKYNFRPDVYPWIITFCPIRGKSLAVENTGSSLIEANLSFSSIIIIEPPVKIIPPEKPNN
jgi:hypothetical protein